MTTSIAAWALAHIPETTRRCRACQRHPPVGLPLQGASLVAAPQSVVVRVPIAA